MSHGLESGNDSEAKRLYFIGAVLFYLVPILEEKDSSRRVNVLVEETLKGQRIHIDGKFDCIL